MSVKQTEGPTLSGTASTAMAKFLRVRLDGSFELALCGTGDSDCLGNLREAARASGQIVGYRANNAPGTSIMIASGSITRGAAVYAGASGKVAGSGTVLIGEAMTATSSNGDWIEVFSTPQFVGAIARSAMQQDDLQPYAISLGDLKTWDDYSTNLPGTAATDDLAVIEGSLGTDAKVVNSEDAKAATKLQYASFMWPVPVEYVDGETLNLVITAGMKTTISDDTAVVDAQVYRQAAPTADINSTAEQSINNITAAAKTFVMTVTDIVAGDLLEVRVTIDITDAGTGTAVIGEITKIEFQADIKG